MAQLITTICFCNSTIVFWAVTTKWIVDGHLPQSNIVKNFVDTAFHYGFKKISGNEFIRHRVCCPLSMRMNTIFGMMKRIYEVMKLVGQKDIEYCHALKKLTSCDGIQNYKAAEIMQILALSGFTQNPMYAKESIGFGHHSTKKFKDGYGITTLNQLETAVSKIANECGYSKALAESCLTAFACYDDIGIKGMSCNKNIAGTHLYRDILFKDQRLYYVRNTSVYSVGMDGIEKTKKVWFLRTKKCYSSYMEKDEILSFTHMNNVTGNTKSKISISTNDSCKHQRK